MDLELVLKALYNNNYFGSLNKKFKSKSITTDVEAIYILSKINDSASYSSIELFIKDMIAKFSKEKLNVLSGNLDSFQIEKNTENITYSFFATIKKLDVLDNVIPNNIWDNIFGISLENIKVISYLLFFRIITFNKLYDSKITSQEKIELFNTTKPSFLFYPEDLSVLSKEITNDNLKRYFEIFSIDITNIENELDATKIIKVNDKYSVVFITDFVKNLYTFCENAIIDYYKLNNLSLDSFYDKRGKNFEKLINNTLSLIYTDVKRGLKYVAQNKQKFEIDNLVVNKDLYLNFECKSSAFNTYELQTQELAEKKVIRGFSDGLKSLDTFLNTVNSTNGLAILNSPLKITNPSNCYILCATLNSLDFISTSLHLTKNIDKYVTHYPIIINFLDLYTIIAYCCITKNNAIFEEYIVKRTFSLNNSHNLVIDRDEINALGFLLDDRNSNIQSFLFKDNNIHKDITINNDEYRNYINETVDNHLMMVIFKKHISKPAFNAFFSMYGIK